MAIGLSLYLDILRFLLALIVLLSHARAQAWTGGILWRTEFFAQPAVIGFFVLSGFVIAYVTDHKEKDLRSYLASRAARLYSVIVPALALTLVVDAWGWHSFPWNYGYNPLGDEAAQPLLRYLGALLMLTSMGVVGYPTGEWHVFFPPGTNWPFWSLSNELIYYLFFAVWLFVRKPRAYALYVLLAFFAGVEIMALFPLWILGVLTYKATRRYTLGAFPGGAMFLLSALAGLCICMQVDGIWQQKTLLSRALHQDYVIGVLVALNIFGASQLRLFDRILPAAAGVIRWLGLLTFPLYLCHRPLLHFFSGVQVAAPGSWLQNLYLFGAVFLVTAALTVLSERLRASLCKLLGTKRAVDAMTSAATASVAVIAPTPTKPPDPAASRPS